MQRAFWRSQAEARSPVDAEHFGVALERHAPRRDPAVDVVAEHLDHGEEARCLVRDQFVHQFSELDLVVGWRRRGRGGLLLRFGLMLTGARLERERLVCLGRHRCLLRVVPALVLRVEPILIVDVHL
ncbi:hypothetical protein [Actinosynnema mirum]|uniref:hypothetical protein n=1 Tax=Actinosynnema mirum TaxID=40567 RepID=UPI00059F0C55|nr:hypothetical protein [Actinosynnema mirum]